MNATTIAPDEGGTRRKLAGQLWVWVLVAIGAGIVFGLAAPDTAVKAKWLADAFIQLIKTVTGPVIFVTVVIGIASLGNLARAGGLALRALFYFFCATVVALMLGLLAANIVKPGAGFSGSPGSSAQEAAKESIGEAGQDSGVVPFITDHLLPTSFVQPFVDNEILQVLVLAILTAAAVSMLATDLRERVVSVFEDISRIIFGVIRLIMWAAPLGAFGGMAYTVGQFGSASLTNLVLLMVTFWGTCAIFVFGVLGPGRPRGRVQHLQAHPAHPRRAAHHRRHVVVRDGAAAPAGQAAGGRRLAPDRRRRHPDRLLVQPRRHLHLPHPGRDVHHPGLGSGHGDRPADRARRADGPDEQGRRRHHRRWPRHADRVAAGVRRHVLLRREHRRRHRAGGGHRPHHERGPRVDERDRNSVATLAIARWQGELDMDRLRAVLDRPEIVDRDVEAALRGADTADDQDRPAARFERDSSTGAQVLGVGGDGDRRP